MLATSINATRAPEQRASILAGDFQSFACERCSHQFVALGPFVYLDFGRRLFIGVYPAADEPAWAEHEREPLTAYAANLGDDAPAIARPVGEGMSVRTVFGLAALREKIVALEAGLDDAVLEAVKLRMLLDGPAPSVDPARRPRLTEVEGDVLVLHLPAADGGPPTTATVDRQACTDVEADPDVMTGVVGAIAAGPYRDLGRLLLPA